MQARPYKLLNASERAFLAMRADAALGRWLEAWTGGGEGTTVASCTPLSERADLAHAEGWLSYATDVGTLYMAGAAAAHEWAVAFIAGDGGLGAPAEGTLAAELAQRALRELAQRIIGADTVADTQAPPAGLWLRASGAACIDLPSAVEAMATVLDAPLVSHLLAGLTRKTPPLQVLTSPAHGLGHLAVEVRVWLGSAELEISVLQTLAKNDVIVLDSTVAEALRMTVAGKTVGPRAFLGRVGERKAIRLSGPRRAADQR